MMGYENMDHAGWAESNNDAGRQNRKKPKRDPYGNVIGFHGAPPKLSPFHAKVMDILGMIYGGIYNAPINWETVEWKVAGGMAVVVGRSAGWSTFDFDRLTKFVFLCHEARIRGDIAAAGPHGYRLSFFPRRSSGGMSRCHPSLDEAVADFREYLGPDHPVTWQPEAFTVDWTEVRSDMADACIPPWAISHIAPESTHAP